MVGDKSKESMDAGGEGAGRSFLPYVWVTLSLFHLVSLKVAWEVLPL